MNDNQQRIAVAGATGRVGRHVMDVVRERGHEPVAMSRASGVDVVTGEGLDEALRGVHTVIDVATSPSPDACAASMAAAIHSRLRTGSRR